MWSLKKYITKIVIEILDQRQEYQYFRFANDYLNYKKGDIVSGVFVKHKILNGEKCVWHVAINGNNETHFIRIENFDFAVKGMK